MIESQNTGNTASGSSTVGTDAPADAAADPADEKTAATGMNENGMFSKFFI